MLRFGAEIVVTDLWVDGVNIDAVTRVLTVPGTDWTTDHDNLLNMRVEYFAVE